MGDFDALDEPVMTRVRGAASFADRQSLTSYRRSIARFRKSIKRHAR
jgi:hypothetical protein